MVTVKPVPPAGVFVGETAVMGPGAGLFAALLILKVTDEDVPPPGVGLVTVTDAVPAVVRSEAGTLAVIEVALT